MSEKLESCPFEEPAGQYEIVPAKKKRTRFDKITESPETLANFIDSHFDFCDAGCSRCIIEEKCLYLNKDNKSSYELTLEWLNEETDND